MHDVGQRFGEETMLPGAIQPKHSSVTGNA